MNDSRTQKAIAWILAAPKRTQREAAKKFGITQCTVSLGLKAYFRKYPGEKPDGRKRWKR